jgi:mRNA interferase YafQ
VLVQKVTRRFIKDRRLMKKRNKDTNKLDELMLLITDEEPLPERYHEHLLHGGNYEGCTECHIEPDWLLVYRIEDDIVHFARTGSHADLF